MLIKVSELEGAALDWAVAKCEGYVNLRNNPHAFNQDLIMNRSDGQCVLFNTLKFSSDWSWGGPIIERMVFKVFRNVGGNFTAQIKRRVPYYSPTYDADIGMDEIVSYSGPTMLIAAMRCYVAIVLGSEIEVPDSLI